MTSLLIKNVSSSADGSDTPNQALRSSSTFVWLVVWTILAQLCALGCTKIFTVSLSREDFGVYATLISFHFFHALFGNLSLNTVVPREMRRAHSEGRLLGAYLTITLSMSVILGLLIAGMLSFSTLTTEARYFFILFAAGLAVASTMQPFLDTRFAHGRAARLSVIVEAIALAVCTALFLDGKLSLVVAVLIYTTRVLGSQTCFAIFYAREFAPEWPKWNRHELSILLSGVRNLFPSLVMGAIPPFLGVLLVRAHTNAGETAIYAIAHQVHAASLLFWGLALRVYYAHVAESERKAPGRHNGRASLRLIAGVASIFFLASAGVGTALITTVFDPRYLASIPVFSVLIFGDFLIGVRNALVVHFAMDFRHRVLFRTEAIGVLAYGIGFLLVRDRFSSQVAAYTYAGAMAVNLIYPLIASSKKVASAPRDR